MEGSEPTDRTERRISMQVSRAGKHSGIVISRSISSYTVALFAYELCSLDP